jgi:tetratricopeptide (TPR) repeat protein
VPLAIEDFNIALRCTPALEVFAQARSQIFTMRGLTLLDEGGSAKALGDADSAVALDSTSLVARLLRGRARLATGAPQLAITDFDFLLVRDTLRSEALYYLALAYRQSGQTAVALSVLRRLTRGDPKDLYVMKAKDELRSMKAPR